MGWISLKMAEQQILDISLPRRRAFERDDFYVSASNATALAMIEAEDRWPNRQLLLTGPEGAGKTHLAQVWMERTGAERVLAANLREDDVAALASIGAIVIEDFDQNLAVPNEVALFHLMNMARAEGATLLLTARKGPSNVSLTIRDLASRLASLAHVQIEAPDNALMQDMIIKQFRDRHLIVAKPVVAYLARRIERSAKAARNIVDQLDRISRSEAHGITIPLIREHVKF